MKHGMNIHGISVKISEYCFKRFLNISEEIYGVRGGITYKTFSTVSNLHEYI